VGYKPVFTKEGKPLPKNYLHHILMLNTTTSVSCEANRCSLRGQGWR